ncbi:MAG: hypothetical protein L6V93_09445 [Clostridiales bacterium]|nr:MAG: hypothetical protein L6V93_09445 [Clostridiales bacterium]
MKECVKNLFLTGLKKYNPDIIRFGYTLVYPDGTRKLPNKNRSAMNLLRRKIFTEKFILNL